MRSQPTGGRCLRFNLLLIVPQKIFGQRFWRLLACFAWRGRLRNTTEGRQWEQRVTACRAGTLPFIFNKSRDSHRRLPYFLSHQRWVIIFSCLKLRACRRPHIISSGGDGRLKISTSERTALGTAVRHSVSIATSVTATS